MIKWGARLIGFLFFIWAAWDLFILITDSKKSSGFLGISGWITYNGKDVEILGWVSVCVFAYIGFHLFRLHMEGRTWALVVLWSSTIFSGIFFILFTILSIASITSLKEISIGLYLFDESRKIDNPTIVLLIIGLFFLFYAIQLYFLMRKDVKMEFQKTEEAKELS